MNLKKTIALSVLAVASGISAHASILVAGWDFGNFTYTDLTVESNWSDVTGDANMGGSANATLHMDGQYGSSELQNGFIDNSVGVKFSDVDKNRSLSSSDDRGPLDELPLNNTAMQLMPLANGSSITFAVNALSGGDIYDPEALTYGVSITNGGGITVSILWEISFNTEGGWLSLGSQDITASESSGGIAESVDLTAAGAGSEFFIRGTVSGLGASNTLNIDNVQILGNVVPEPSTYAAIAGGLALAFVALRRRFRK